MNGAIKWMAHNHVAANLLMLLFIVGGLVMGFSVKQEVFPEIDLEQVQISVAYPGAGPDEVEEGIILAIEEAISGIDGLKELTARASEGVGMVTATLQSGADADRFLQDIKSEIDRVTTFPQDAEEPVITKMIRRREVASLVVYGDVPERTLREQAEFIRDELLDKKEITQADLSGVRPYEISIEIPEKNLRRYNLTLDEVARRVRAASQDLPGGAIKTATGQILLRIKERRYTGHEYGNIIIMAGPDGGAVHLRDIALIRDDFAETDQFARFNGLPAAMIRVFRVGNQKPTMISDLIHQYAEDKRPNLPESLHIEVWNDTSELLDSRMNLLLKNAGLGLIMVFLTLGLFLQIRLALWVMLGIPISFFGALLFMPALDVSINMISLFAFIMALGIVVDDAIVIGENIFEHRQKNKSHLQAAIDGAREVGIPVTFSILTSVAAFVPLLSVTGGMGKFIRVIPLVVISILIVSLIESLFILPAHLSFGNNDKKKKKAGWLARLRLSFVKALNQFVQGPYRRLLVLHLEYRYAALAFAIAILLVSVGLLKGGIIKFHFMPEVEGDKITATLTMPLGTPVEETARISGFMVRKAQEVIADYDRERGSKESSLRQIFSLDGGTMTISGPHAGPGSTGAHLASVSIILTPSEVRNYPASDITARWRQKVGEIPGAESLTFSSNLMKLGANIDVALAHDNFSVLVESAARLKESLSQYPGVADIADTYPLGKKELKLRLKPAARSLGVTEHDLGRQVRAAFYGAEALRLQRGRNEVKVMVRFPETERRHLLDFTSMRIRTPDGGALPLEQAAFIEPGRGFSEINRTDRKRVINVSASVDSTKADSEEILTNLTESILQDLIYDFPGLSFNLEGEAQERRDSLGSMMRGFLLALIVMYALLAIPFRSYSQPFLIMAAIPFGAAGAMAGHLLMGYNLSILSLFGMVALSGVVVNDSLLLIDQANRNRKSGAEPFDAILASGVRRFRPILLTSLTTFFGLTPIILETSVQAKFLIPMAISLGFGIMFATGITLLLVPILYIILEDFKKAL